MAVRTSRIESPGTAARTSDVHHGQAGTYSFCGRRGPSKTRWRARGSTSRIFGRNAVMAANIEKLAVMVPANIDPDFLFLAAAGSIDLTRAPMRGENAGTGSLWSS